MLCKRNREQSSATLEESWRGSLMHTGEVEDTAISERQQTAGVGNTQILELTAELGRKNL